MEPARKIARRRRTCSKMTAKDSIKPRQIKISEPDFDSPFHKNLVSLSLRSLSPYLLARDVLLLSRFIVACLSRNKVEKVVKRKAKPLYYTNQPNFFQFSISGCCYFAFYDTIYTLSYSGKERMSHRNTYLPV